MDEFHVNLSIANEKKIKRVLSFNPIASQFCLNQIR